MSITSSIDCLRLSNGVVFQRSARHSIEGFNFALHSEEKNALKKESALTLYSEEKNVKKKETAKATYITPIQFYYYQFYSYDFQDDFLEFLDLEQIYLSLMDSTSSSLYCYLSTEEDSNIVEMFVLFSYL